MRVRPSEAELHAILGAGLMAPSAENKHYLRLRIDSDSVVLISTDTDLWPEQPHRALLAYVAYGAVVENIALKAAEAGWAVGVEWRNATSADPLVATLRWNEAVGKADPLVRAIESRHTNRRFYRRQPVESLSLARVAGAAGAIDGCRLVWLDTPAQRSAALSAMRLAETERFRRQRLHEELFGAVRFEAGWHETTDEGLPPAALEIEPPMRAAFAALRHWPLARALRFVGGDLALGLRAAYLPAALSPHIGVVLAPGEALTAIALGGRAFQRAWLSATAEGLAMQPMAAVPALLRQRPGAGWVDAGAQARIGRLLARAVGSIEGTPCMLFRLGLSAPPSAVTGRRALAGYLDATNHAASEMPMR